MSQERALQRFLTFIHRCSRETSCGSDYNMVQAIFSHMGTMDFPKQEQLASEANVSSSSLIRFIRSFGFENYEDFKLNIGLRPSAHYKGMKLLAERKYSISRGTRADDRIYAELIDNIRATHDHLNYALIDQIIESILEADSVTFSGDVRDLESFETFINALMSTGIPAYAFHSPDTREHHAKSLTEESVLILLNVSDRSFYEDGSVQYAIDHNSRIIAFSQEKLNIESSNIIEYRYGIPYTDHAGYVSLQYLSEVLTNSLLRAN